MQDIRITFTDSTVTIVEIISDEKPPVLDHEDLQELEVKLDNVIAIEYRDGKTWLPVEYER